MLGIIVWSKGNYTLIELFMVHELWWFKENLVPTSCHEGILLVRIEKCVMVCCIFSPKQLHVVEISGHVFQSNYGNC